MFEPFTSHAPGQPAVQGFVHRPESDALGALVLTHGAGSNCRAPVLVAVAEAFSAGGIVTLRCDLPFRQARSHGPPLGNGTADRAGLRRAITVLREIAPGRMFLGGHSYGGRQESMLAAEDSAVADGLLLLSYPLHPPEKPEQLRTAHFPALRTPALFVHGSRDPFGSLEEMRSALALIPAAKDLLAIEAAGHDLGRGTHNDVARRTLAAFTRVMSLP